MIDLSISLYHTHFIGIICKLFFLPDEYMNTTYRNSNHKSKHSVIMTKA